MEEDEGVSMVDVLEEEQMMEEDAKAVLGGSDDKNCSYDMGYITRQALYACVDCSKDKDKPAGICLACSLECHDGHELYELYTKRNFRCDCGNQRMTKECSLRPKKQENVDNNYNQNFRGLYCTCHRPYPDPEDPIDDDMIQCIVCEDWYHGRHLGSRVPADSQFDEMICQDCLKQHPFISDYITYAVVGKVTKVKSSETSNPVDVETVESENIKLDSDKTNCDISESANSEHSSEKDISSDKSSETNADIVKTESQKTGSDLDNPPKDAQPPAATDNKDETVKSDGESSSSGQPAAEAEACVLAQLRRDKVTDVQAGALFFKQSWRSKLCKCDKCKELYSSEGVEYLLLEEDTVQAYEDRGKAKDSGPSQYDKGMAALTSINRVQLAEVMHGYNDLKASMNSYLQKFAENKKVVRPEDIKEFFQELQARKKQKTQATAAQHFCR